MSFLKKYIAEVLFLASFLLPFLKTTITNNEVETVNITYGFELLFKYFYFVFLVLVFYVLFIKFKKKYLKYLSDFFYFLFLLYSITSGDIIRVAPIYYPVFFAEILPKIYQIGLPINFILSLIVIFKSNRIKEF